MAISKKTKEEIAKILNSWSQENSVAIAAVNWYRLMVEFLTKEIWLIYL